MKKTTMIVLAALLLAACQSKHQQLQQQIEQRKEALKQHQDSALSVSEKDVQRLDSELQVASARYEELKRAADVAHANGTGTAEQFQEVTLMRLKRDSLQTQFDVTCSKIKYIKKLKEADKAGEKPK